MPVSPAALVARAAQGDDDAWAQLIRQYGRLVWAVINSIGLVHEDADDVWQTVWLRLAQHLPRLTDPDRVAAWLTTVAKRESLRARARADREVPIAVVPEPPTMRPSPENLVIDAETRSAVAAALERLSPRCQAVLLLLSADLPTSYRDLARMLDMQVGGVGPTRSRCLAHLRQLLADVGIVGETGCSV